MVTLVVKELHGSHDGQAVNRVLKQTLDSFGITKEQIYSFTIDNGSNLIRATNIMINEEEDEPMLDESHKSYVEPELDAQEVDVVALEEGKCFEFA